MERDGHSLSFSFSLADRIWGPLVSTLKQAGARFWLGTQLSHPWPGHHGSLSATHVRINQSECEIHGGNKATTGTTSNSLAQHDPYQKNLHWTPLWTSFLPIFIFHWFFQPPSLCTKFPAISNLFICSEQIRGVTQHNENQSEYIQYSWEAGLKQIFDSRLHLLVTIIGINNYFEWNIAHFLMTSKQKRHRL